MVRAVLATLLLTGISAKAQLSDVYVANAGTSSVTYYDGNTGAFKGTFVPTGSGALSTPDGIVFGPDGDLHVASYTNRRILRYDGTTGAFVATFLQLSAADKPFSIIFGPDHRLYVSSSNGNRVPCFDGSTAQPLGYAASGSGLTQPIGLAIGPDSMLYVVNSVGDNIMRFNPNTGVFLGTIGADSLNFPSDCAFGPDNRLYVSNTSKGRIDRFDYQTGAFIDVFGTMPGGGAPVGIVFQTDGRLFVGDFSNNRLIRFETTGGVGTVVSLTGLASPENICIKRPWPDLGSVIEVPGEQPTIQSGINAAKAGDTVLVDHGTYVENVKIKKKAIVLTSRYAVDQDPSHITQTIIDGSSPLFSDSGSCVLLYKGPGATVQGFTITGGTGTKWVDISDGLTFREGGGILADSTSATIQYNIIAGNKATDKTGATSAGGGGIRCGFGGSKIYNNIVAFNEALYGGGVVSFFNPAEVKNNIIWRNSGGQDFGGGGLWIWQGTGATAANNTIVENRSVGAGGGISLSLGTPSLINNIVRGNTSSTAPQIFKSATATESTVDYSDVQSGYAGTSNIDQLPVYADSNYLLTPGSPCVDAGSPSAPYNDIEDGGNPGNALFPGFGSLTNDIGAYGGPRSASLPKFNSPQLSLQSGSLDFGNDSVGHTAQGEIRLDKLQFGLVSIDSISFSTAASGLTVGSTFPRSMLIAKNSDTISLSWTPTNLTPLSTTARIYHSDPGVTNPLLVTITGTPVGGCCQGLTGNVDCDPGDGTDIADLASLIDYLYISFTPLCCTREANTDGSIDGGVDISDLAALIDYLYISFSPVAPCL